MKYISSIVAHHSAKILIILLATLVMTSAVNNNSDKYFEIAKNLEIFTNIYKELNTNYVDDLEPNQLIRTGIDAMMNSLDPYTVYYSESQVESYRISVDGKYNGLGASSQNIDDKVTITEIYKDGPAEKSGLKVGDQITHVNGQSAEGKSYDDVLMFIRGYPGTVLNLTVERPVDDKSYNFQITRSEVDIPNVPYYGMISEDVGYVHLSTFTNDASNNIAKGIRKLRDQNQLKGLVLDLRGNGGGLLSEAIDILGLFLPQGTPVVSTKGKVKDRDQNYSTRRLPIDMDLPLVVLVDKNSASASEIVSGSIQDMDRGVVMGQRTYGKGLVQNHKEVGYNSRIKITTSKYYIPSGRCIQSVAYENGEPKDIPDSDREVFYTRNKRPVLDGGGVTPDVKLEPKEDPEILQALKKDHWIFKFANSYVHEHSPVDSFEAFTFNDYQAFKNYLTVHNFSFKTSKEEALELLKSDGGSYTDALRQIQEKINTEKADDLDQYESLIKDEIEAELSKRYFLQEGKTRQMLKNDNEVREAIKLLNYPDKYASILNKV